MKINPQYCSGQFLGDQSGSQNSSRCFVHEQVFTVSVFNSECNIHDNYTILVLFGFFQWHYMYHSETLVVSNMMVFWQHAAKFLKC